MPKISSIIPITDLSERCDQNKGRYWLGLSRLSRIPDGGFPQRDICRKLVSDDEVKKGTALIVEYRSQEQLALDNDVSVARERIRHPETTAFASERLREQIRGMSEEKFFAAQSRLNEIRKEAYELCIPILKRLQDQFDQQLHEITIKREAELQEAGIPLFSDGNDIAGYPVRRFECHNDPIVNNLQVRREMCRHKVLGLEPAEAIGLTQWLTSDETGVPFHWL